MALFNIKKKEYSSCSYSENFNEPELNSLSNNNENGASVKILGSGCKKCNQLEANTIEALKQLKLNTKIEHITDFSVIASYGVMTTPAIVYNRKVISYGKVLKPEEIVELLKKEGV